MKRNLLTIATLAVFGWTTFWAASAEPVPATTNARQVVHQDYSADHKLPPFNTKYFQLSPELTFDAKTKSIRLARSVLLTDEMGATDYKQTERLSLTTHAKKVFRLKSNSITSAELLFFGRASKITFNGTVIPSERLKSTGWSRANVPVNLLRTGDNVIIFQGGGQLLVEPTHKPGHSYKSNNNGLTWSNKSLTATNNRTGEYLVRLRLGRLASRGTATSPVFDLWNYETSSNPSPIYSASLLQLDRPGIGIQKQPGGTRIEVSVRTGSTPRPSAKWTDWIPCDKGYKPKAEDREHRWGQYKFEFVSNHPQQSPTLPSSFRMAYVVDAAKTKSKYTTQFQHSAANPPSVEFTYQAPSPRLKLLRERYELEKIIEPGKTDMEKLMLLRHWVRNQWHTGWGSHPASWMPPWDAHIILQNKDQDDCLTMCTHYAAVYTQCCQALGWNARHCILDHHCVSEVYADVSNADDPPQFRWIMMDPGNSKQRPDCNLHYEQNGVPMSALDLHLAHRYGLTKGITVHFTPLRLIKAIAKHCRPFPKKLPPRPDVITLDELGKYPVCHIQNFRRYAFPGRNNFLQSLYPGELYQGWAPYFYDGYWWVGDDRDAPTISPEYSRHLSPKRKHDIDWELNGTRIYLAQANLAGNLQVDLATFTPNFDHFEIQRIRKDKATVWEKTPASFSWTPQLSGNMLTVRSVNRWGRTGMVARVSVQFD